MVDKRFEQCTLYTMPEDVTRPFADAIKISITQYLLHFLESLKVHDIPYLLF